MLNNVDCNNWKEFLPRPVFDEKKEYIDFYNKAWHLAYKHIKHIDGMPQTPYMDEAFCDTQVWVWDSCFMSLFCKYAREVFPGVETLNNFYEVLYNKKHLAKIIPGENEPDWTGATPGVPYEMKIHIADNPPLFAWAEYENALMSGDKDYIKELLYNKQFLQKHYEWIENLKTTVTLDGVMHPTHLTAHKYGYKWEGGKSGMDNTPRGRIGEHAYEERPNNPDMFWLDAICQQALSAKMISELFKIIDDKVNYEKWHTLYLEKKNIINELYWDEEDGFYYDIDCNTHKFYKVKTIASYWTLTGGIASEGQAKKLVERLLNENEFGGKVPFVSLSRDDPDFIDEGEYWRGGVWTPTAYATLKGLVRYGYLNEARKTSKQLLDYMIKTYNDFEPHTIWEAYSPTEYKPATDPYRTGTLSRPDFCGWSALGPISMFIEYIIGFYKIDAFEKKIYWAMPDEIKGKIGIKNLSFGGMKTDIYAIDDKCYVESDGAYTLIINGTEYSVNEGKNEFIIK